jgi:aldehyde dehydrogenase (NAD+)
LSPWLIESYVCLRYAAFADKYGGQVKETPFYGLTASLNEPVGVIGMVCPKDFPLLGFVSLVGPAVVRGNTCVVCPSQEHPLAATDLYQVLDTSDLPGGVINIITGNSNHIAKTMVEHQHVDAMWYFRGGIEGIESSYNIERLSASNMKRTFVDYGESQNMMNKLLLGPL